MAQSSVGIYGLASITLCIQSQGLPELGCWDGAVGWLSGEGTEMGREDAQQGAQPPSVVGCGVVGDQP